MSLLQGALFPAAIPLILGALAGVIGERSGVVNVALEGQLLLGAFVAAVAARSPATSGSGVLGGMLAGVVIGALLAVFAIRYLVDQVIIGVVLNLFALGITSFLYQKLLSNSPHAVQQPRLPSAASRSRCSATSRSSVRCCSTARSSCT